MIGSTSSKKLFSNYLVAGIIFILLFQFADSLKCCQNNAQQAKCAQTCVGERCLKLLSPGGRTIRQCINGTDPAYNFKGFQHNEDGEDAYICDNEDRCNSAQLPLLSCSLLIFLFINFFVYLFV